MTQIMKSTRSWRVRPTRGASPAWPEAILPGDVATEATSAYREKYRVPDELLISAFPVAAEKAAAA